MTLKLDFYGESTFRGYGGGVERDNPTPAKNSNSANSFALQADNADGNGNYMNVPRRVVERLAADAGYPSTHNNFAMSSTAITATLNGNSDLPGGIATVSGGTDANIALINTGINDAVNGVSVATFRANMAAVIQRAVRTGKVVFVMQPNSISLSANQRLAEYYTGFQTWLNSQAVEIKDNTVFVATSVNGDADGVHPNSAGYEVMRWQTVNALIATNRLVVAPRQRLIAELYIMMFNRAPEAEGMDYWTGELGIRSEAQVAQIMYSVVPAFSGMTSAQLVTAWYSNLFSAPPDTEGLNYWVGRINAIGQGGTAIELLWAVRNQVGTTHKLLLTHRANVGVAHGARLKRTSITFSLTGVTTDPASVYATTASI